MEHIHKLLEKGKLSRDKALSYVRNLYRRSKYCYLNDEERTKTEKLLRSGAPVKVQAMDWFSRNEKITVEYVDESSDDCNSTEQKEETQFVIYMYGITEYGETITARFTDYTPYFYVKMPDWMSEAVFRRILDEAIESNFNKSKQGQNMFEYYKKDLIECSFCQKIDFWGFQNKEKSKFARLTFRNTYAMKAYAWAFEKPIKIHQSICNLSRVKFSVYESNIDSMLRFFHWRDIQPCGWLEILDYNYNINNEFSITNFEVEADWKSVSSKPEDCVGRIFEAAFDIECDSSDGGFPLAIKDWSKIVNPLLDEFILNDLPDDYVRDYIIDKVNTGHLVPKEPIKNPEKFFADKFGPADKAIINQYFNKLADTTLERRAADNKEKKAIDERLDKIRDDLVKHLNGMLPLLEGDKCIQIGTTIQIYGMDTKLDFIFTLKSATIPEKPNAIVWCFDTEEEVLLEFTKLLQALDPDVLTGYNIFGFDMKFMYERAKELNIEAEFLKMSRMSEFQCPYKKQDLSSSAMGTVINEYIDIPGRVVFDTMKYMRRNHQLESYKLDAVVNNFMRGEVKKTEPDTEGRGTWLYSELSEGIKEDNYITMQKNNYVYEDKYKGGEKIQILAVDPENSRFLINDHISTDPGWKYSWSEGKDDISPQQIFEYQKLDEVHRGIIAKYCLQDCRLCNRLLYKLDIIINSVAMANVNSVPISFIFNRGQGIKLFSFVSKRAKDRGYCIPVIRHKEKEDGEEDDSYEGAFVLDPKVGIYFDKDPIAVADFNSLYPSCMISENLCHTTVCLDPKYQGNKGATLLKSLGHTYEDIKWDLYDEKDNVNGEQVVRFVQPKDGERGVLPEILEILLKCRKDVRAVQKKIKDPQKWKVLEGQQLAYKVTANSLYGVTGASTSQLCLKFIAAATTATGRKNIMFAKNFVEREYPGTQVVYGDTDSIFIKFPVGGLSGLDAIYKSIDLCEESAGRISEQLKKPHNLEFEKVICPMILCAKKKYVGFYYTGKSPKCTIKYMGIVLKRRDNAPIVKHVFGEAIEILLKENNVPKAISFIQEASRKILAGGYGIDKFIMSKTLKDSYKNPDGIAHKVLADRIGEREPGNKPMINDRVPFVYVEQETEIKGTRGSKAKKKVLQGDKIENPDYVVKNKMPIDYLHYITNQIINPVCQVFDLVMKDSEGVIFGDIVREEKKRREMKAMKKAGYQDISKFFSKKK
jgi:DNA polymerase elongation subunit (family B)